MKIFHSNNVVLSLIASELKLVLILHSIPKLFHMKSRGSLVHYFVETKRDCQKIDHVIVRFLAKCASITCDSFNGR